MKKALSSLLAVLALGAGSGAALQASAADRVDVYKSPYCGCCSKWIDHLKAAGFEVRSHDVSDVPAARQQLGMPEQFGSCHTAKVGGYLVEGHVPAADIKRLLREKPQAIGLAAPGMPPGSPGMEGPKPLPYNTLLVKNATSSEVFAKH
jgi:hypothetical protein